MRPKKIFGQNFLNSRNIVNDIIRAADLRPDDVVLEVGPGKGILTEALLEAVPRGKVIAVEKDKRLVEFLKEKFSGAKNLKIISGDILKFNFTRYSLRVTRYAIVANIPYYITSHFLRKFLESDYSPSRMVLMLQKEVAERIATRSTSLRASKESILSISVKAYGEPKIIKKVPARYFFPAPKVDSAILLIDNISPFDYAQDEKKFFEIVKQGFSQKRKMLKNNLAKMLNTECSTTTTILTKCGVKEKARAENLTPENWRCLADNLSVANNDKNQKGHF